MSLYRKYRPLGFIDVVGQDHIVKTLEEAAKQDKLAHAYLFAGNRGTGKTSVARILSKTIMTRGVADEKLREHIGKAIEEGSIVDLLEIDAASNRGIDDIRDLIEKIQFSPVVAGAKVYIVDEVHMLTKEAFNALLKTLEEPPPYAFFILATTELQKIPATIQSRCQCFPFRNIRDEDIVRRLQFIADQERIKVDREALRAIARHAQGGMRDAISLLDQLRSLETVTADDVRRSMGPTGHDYVEGILQAIENSDVDAVITSIRAMEDVGIQLDVFVRHVLDEVRASLHKAAAEKTDFGGFVAMTDTLLQALKDMRSSPLPGLVLESALIELMNPSQKRESAPPVQNVTRSTPVRKTQESRAEHHAPSAPTEERTASALVHAGAVDLTSVRAQWNAVVKAVEPASVRMSLKNAVVADVSGDTIRVRFTSDFHKDKVAHVDASRSIEKILEDIFKKPLRLECAVDAGLPTSSPTRIAEDDGVNLAEAASEIF